METVPLTNKDWAKLYNMVCDAQRAFNDLDEFQRSDNACDVDLELNAYAERVSSLRGIIYNLEELVREREQSA